MLVVVTLEVIEIQPKERERPAVALGPANFQREDFVAAAAVGQAGQRVGNGLVREVGAQAQVFLQQEILPDQHDQRNDQGDGQADKPEHQPGG